VLSGEAAAGRQLSALSKQKEITMKKIMYIAAIVMSLVGSANLAMAQPDMGVTTGSEANTEAHIHGR